ncbi:MAG: HD domain-containing protein [Clostridiales bacterium]|nr:HD domain-containing protein [Clostridiales bacterium]
MSEHSEQNKVNTEKVRANKKLLRPRVLAFIICGIALNFLLSTLVRQTDLPFYIDTVGTIVVTAIGGIIPGIITALCTNIINFTMDGESIFYASLNMMIAIATGYYFESGKIKTKSGKFFFILVTALIGGGIGSVITWFLYRSPSDSPMIVSIMEFLQGTFKMSVFWAHVIATFVTDFMDKAISVMIALITISTLPEDLKASLKFSGWKHKKLTSYEQGSVISNISGRMSIGMRTILTIVLSTFIMTIIVTWFSLINYHSITTEQTEETAEQIAYIASTYVDPEKVNEYIRYGHKAEGYDETCDKMMDLLNSSDDIQFLYVYKPENNGCRVVFDMDAYLPDGTFVPGVGAGSLVDYEEGFVDYRENLLLGDEVPTLSVTDNYGEYIMCYYPVRDVNGHTVCYAVSNIKLEVVDSFTTDFIGRVVLLFAGFFILIVVVGVWTARYRIVMPIAGMTSYADEVAFMDDEHYAEKLKKMESLDIHTGDEMELLYKALCKMTSDTVVQMSDIKQKSEEISKMQTGLIITMADMVESRDSDIGAHVQKTAAYVRIILEGLKRNGYYIEKLTDKYIRDVEMSAPLHDIGKIAVSDTVLNKPGKLTDEEFAIMKTHTTEGRKIIESAISKVEGDSYLKEARNMAGYHHERWDGKGYPEGLHGEVIPLSARVMAVADVFDALVSPRIYKPAFPLDKALSIIKEGAGTQFDPKVVEVFMESIDEAVKIMNKFKED